MFLKRTLAAGAFVVATAVAASAADIPVAPVAPPPPPPMPIAPVFDWSGPYVGVYGGAIFAFGTAIAQGGVQAGYNFVSGGFLAGLEVEAEVRGPPAFPIHFGTGVNARIGAILGSNVLVYTTAGVHWQSLFPGWYWTAGGGLEVALGQSISLFAEGAAVGFGGGCCVLQVQAGLNWHP